MRYAAITDRLSSLGSGKWGVHLRARELAAAGADIIELTIGEPDVRPDQTLLEECSRAMFAGRTAYSNGRGEPSVVDALVTKYRRRRADVTARNILCFPGTQTALFAAMLGLAEAGNGVLVGDPLYATYEGVIAASGARAVMVPLRSENGFRMTAGDVEAAITPDCRVLLLNSPHNPTGAVLSASEIAEIGQVCIKHDLWILSDEVYEDLIFGGSFASPFDNPELASRTVVVSSISKSHAAPGFRSGWAIGPEEFADRLLPVSETMLFGGQPFIADMTAMAINGSFDTAVTMTNNYSRRAGRVCEILNGKSDLAALMPQAGMFILVDVSATGMAGEEFAWKLLEAAEVAVMPGGSFGQQARQFVRISLTVADEVLETAMHRMAGFADHLSENGAKRA